MPKSAPFYCRQHIDVIFQLHLPACRLLGKGTLVPILFKECRPLLGTQTCEKKKKPYSGGNYAIGM
jgi:hypothetical protein